MTKTEMHDYALSVASSLPGARNATTTVTDRFALATRTYDLIRQLVASPIELVKIPDTTLAQLELVHGQCLGVVGALTKALGEAEKLNATGVEDWAETEVAPRLGVDPVEIAKKLDQVEKTFERAGNGCKIVAELASFALGTVDAFYATMPMFRVR